MRPLISIIVPIYNTQNYLDRCLNSILTQSYKNLEIILIDDGSEDCSRDICDKYAQKDSRIQVICQENKGNNAARKAGINASKGNYITFVDSDDWIEAMLIEELYKQIIKYQADMVVSNVLMQEVNGKLVFRRNLLEPGVYDPVTEAVQKFFYEGEGTKYGVLPFLYAKLYKRDLVIKNIKKIGNEIQYDEDRAFIWTCLLEPIRVVFTDTILYHYCLREDGLVKKTDAMFLAKICYFYDYMKILFNGNDILQKQLNNYVLMLVKGALNEKLGLPLKPLLKNMHEMDPSCFFETEKKIILYGAGNVGKDYYEKLKKAQKIDLCIWADKDFEKYQEQGMPVESISKIKNKEFDYILVAVKKENVFQEIQSELLEKGIEERKIIWGKPYEEDKKCLK